ncbi:hypothetical protein OQA88_5789 [Cercophora sp. LCS_1]
MDPRPNPIVPDVNGLRVSRLPSNGASPNYEEIPPTDPRFSAVAICVHVGLNILESPQGRATLIDTAREILEDRRQLLRDNQILYNDTMERLPLWIGLFLERMRDDFPDIRLVYGLDGEAAAKKADWGNDMRRYNPKAAGYIEVNKLLVDTMVHVGQRATTFRDPNHPEHVSCVVAWETFTFQLGMCIAHEVVHLLTGFLSTHRLHHTPPNVTALGYGDETTGEAGWYWETRMMGGVLNFYEDRRDPLGVHQAGVPILENNRTDVLCVISQTWIRGILNLNFTAARFPARLSEGAPEMSDDDVARLFGGRMADVRAASMLPRISPPPPDPNLSRNLDRLRFRTYRHRLEGRIRPSMVAPQTQSRGGVRGRA